MPHLTLEYTSNLPRPIATRDLLGRLHRVLEDVGGIDVALCKSRAVALDTFLAGDHPDGGAFVHLDVRMLEGRPADLKSALGAGLLELLRDAYDAAEGPIQITVEIRDMARAQYFKADDAGRQRGSGDA